MAWRLAAVINVLLLVLFLLLRCVWNICQRLKWSLDGTWKQLIKGRTSEYYERSAHVLDVKYKYIGGNAGTLPASIKYYILNHREFVHPDYVLKDNISIYTYSEEEVYFVEASPGVEDWRSDVRSFHKDAQFCVAKRIIVMPITSLYRLADQLAQKPQPKIVIGYALPRSGSTLLCSIFEKTGCCVSYSEPAMITEPYYSVKKYQNQEEKEESQRLLVAALHLLCKPRSYPVQAFFIKAVPGHSKLDLSETVLTLQGHFSDIHFMFNYRNCRDIMRSALKLRKQFDVIVVSDMLTPYLPKTMQFSSTILDFIAPNEREEFKELIGSMRKYVGHPNFLHIQAVFMLAAMIRQYCTFSQLHPSVIHVIKYEDLVQEPRDVITSIFVHCGLSDALTDEALTALENDAQENSPLSRERMSKYKVEDPSEDIRDALYKICMEYNIPRYDSDFRL